MSFPSAAKPITFTTADSTAVVNMGFRMQGLATYSSSNSGEDIMLNGLIRRMRLKFDGYVLSPKFGYKLELALSNRDMGNRRDEMQVGNSPKLVLDAVFKYNLNSHHSIWFGQTKLPGNRERVISSQKLQFVDRSAVNGRFNIDRDFGLWYWYKRKDIKVPMVFALAVTRGEGRNITIANERGLSYSGRIEIYPFGNFTSKGDYFGADLKREQKPKLAIGVSFCHNDQTDRSAGQLGSFVSDSIGPLYNTLQTTFIDAMFKFKGFSLMTEYANRTVSKSIDGFSSGTGFVVQSGYIFYKNLELAVRYTDVDLYTAGDQSLDYLEYTIGLSNYILDHKLKWQCDFGLIENFDVTSQLIRFQVEIGI